MDIKEAIANVIEHQDLSRQEMTDVMQAIMTGQTTPAQIAGFLVSLRMKGETVDEIVGAASVMRELATRIPLQGEHLVDTCGTGGDTAHLFNVSTACTFVVAAAGGRVAKHGNRSVSSKSGSADVLETAGIKLDLNADEVARCVDAVGVGFLFAPAHHSAMKHAIGPRKEMAVRTIFNLLGPLSNPAGVKNQVIGVFDRKWLRPIAEVSKALGSEHVLVVHGSDGLDEISVSAESYVAELKDGVIEEYEITPEQFGLNRGKLIDLTVTDSASSLTVIKKALSKSDGGSASDIVAINAGAAIYAANLCQDLNQGIHMAQDAIQSGRALEKLNELIQFTQCFKE